jgi:hypothetical protein
VVGVCFEGDEPVLLQFVDVYPSPKFAKQISTLPQGEGGALDPRSVFLNCPFDDDFKSVFRAIVLTVVAGGFTPRCALERLDSSDTVSTRSPK